jgi:phenylalanyl-tRNA synthetase beta chain
LFFDRSVTFEQVKEITEEKEFSGVLREIIVFDCYIGEKIGDDKKAYALGFILQDKTRTLTDKAIDRTMRRLMNKFESKLGAVIRQ